MAFTSDPSTHRQCFNVTITDDEALEDTERFRLRLDLVPGGNIPVVVSPDISAVDILDDDGWENNFKFPVSPRLSFMFSLQLFLLDSRGISPVLMRKLNCLNCVLRSSQAFHFCQLISNFS